MTITISNGATELNPALLLSWRSTRDGATIYHQAAAGIGHDVTLRPASPRTGTLHLLALTGNDAAALEQLHANASMFTYTDTDLPLTNMSYIVPDDGRIELELDEETRLRWIVRIDYRQVTP